jgi:hypothetical protein
MSFQSVLAPVFVEALLNLVVLFWSAGLARRGAGSEAGAPADQALLLTVLFFGVLPVAFFAHKADLIFVLLAWVYVAIHALAVFGRLGSSSGRPAFVVAGALVLAALWGEIALRVLLAI